MRPRPCRSPRCTGASARRWPCGLWTDARTRQTRKIQVATVFQGDVVNLTATFKTLASGLNHVDFGEVMVSAKQLSLQVQNFNYNKNN